MAAKAIDGVQRQDGTWRTHLLFICCVAAFAIVVFSPRLTFISSDQRIKPPPSVLSNVARSNICSGGPARAAWDWRKELGLPPGQGAINFKELLTSLVQEEDQTKFALNFGAREGVIHDPVHSILQDLSFGGLAFEGNPEVLDSLRTNMAAVNSSGRVHVVPGYVTSSSAVSTLSKYQVPRNVDVMKVDIDSIDMSIITTVINAGYRPKFVAAEINPDIIPPLQFYLQESTGFGFSHKNALKGLYGVSPEALFQFMVAHDYRLIELELVDPNDKCQRCEHNMWFAHNGVLRKHANTPPPASYKEFVQMFWQRGPMCLHVEEPFCSVAQVSKLLANVTGADASLMLLAPQYRATAYRLLGSFAGYVQTICPTCSMHFEVSQAPGCFGSATP